MSFATELQAFARLAKDRQDKVLRAASLRLFSSIVQATPVDKGVLRNNWYCSLNGPSYQTTTTPAPVGTATIGRIREQLASVRFGEDIYLSNNLPYAYRIEFDGWSAQAPSGMVRTNIVNWEAMVADAVRSAR